MSFGPEAKATLGVDTKQIPADMAKARAAFNQAGAQIEADSRRHGERSGRGFQRAFEERLGARGIATALGTALGINIQGIAESITGALMGGSIEGWKQAIDIADQSTKIIEQMTEERLSPKRLQEKHQKDLSRAEKGLDPGEGLSASQLKTKAVIDALLPKFLANIVNFWASSKGKGATDQDVENEFLKKNLNVLQKQQKVQTDQITNEKQLRDLADQELSIREHSGTLQQQQEAITGHISKLEDEIKSGTLDAVQIEQRKIEIIGKQNELKALAQQMRDREIDDANRLLDLEAKRSQLLEQQTKLKHDEAELTDRNKLTVGELATLHAAPDAISQAAQESEAKRELAFGSGGSTLGLSAEQVEARGKAQEIQRLQARQETARLSGDQAASQRLLDQIATLRDSLKDSGFTKSTEGDPATLLRQQIAKDNKDIIQTLGDIKIIEKGKYVNQ